MLTKAKFSLTGGIHPPGNKQRSSEADLQICPNPEQLMIPMNMHAGNDAIPIVSVGDKISCGQNIAEADRNISAFIHSPVNGVINDICQVPVANRSGLVETVVIIDCDPEVCCTYDDKSEWQQYSPEQLLEIMRLAGVVGLGGAGFPSYQKINSSRSSSHTLLLNGAECEPYISCDDRAMRDFSINVLEGAVILARILDCENIQIAIEDNKQQAIATMVENINKCHDKCEANAIKIEIIEIPTRYPSGGERQLIEIVTGQQVPSGSFPSALGYTVQNVGTALAVYDAVVLSKPLVDRIVTVTGDAVSHPGNYRVTIGTSIRHLLEIAGWDESIAEILIHGGPMMGFPLTDPDRPISKISNCIIAGTTKEFPKPQPERNCIRCGKCAEVCPASLLPQQLLWFCKSADHDKALDFRLMDCIECGACAYVCGSEIPLVDYYRYLKAEIKSNAAAKIKSEKSRQRFEFRQQRLEQQQQERQQQREEKLRLAAERKKQSSATDAKKQAVADALARIQAKKQGKNKVIIDNSKSSEENTDDQK